MSIHRIGEFQAKPETIEDLRAFLQSIRPIILGSEGCEGCELFQSQEDAAKFAMTETWRDIEAHQASVKKHSTGFVARDPTTPGRPAPRRLL